MITSFCFKQRAKVNVDYLSSILRSFINFLYYFLTEKSITLSFTKEMLLLSVTTAYTGMKPAEFHHGAVARHCLEF